MNMDESRVDRIRERLERALRPVSLEIVDDSAKHAGHAGAAGGGGHFIVDIVSPVFANRSPIQRHRLVYDAVDDMMHSEIHALSIQARTPEEA
ncbi:MAG: BolA family protein [Thiohalobacterales bacterium]|nr:BolA family protein [Thiohalobacterales bacterium]